MAFPQPLCPFYLTGLITVIEMLHDTIIGMALGFVSAIGSAYLLFRTKRDCDECRRACFDRIREGLAEREDDVKEIKECMRTMQCELKKALVRQEKIIMALIVALPVPEATKQEILRS